MFELPLREAGFIQVAHLKPTQLLGLFWLVGVRVLIVVTTWLVLVLFCTCSV